MTAKHFVKGSDISTIYYDLLTQKSWCDRSVLFHFINSQLQFFLLCFYKLCILKTFIEAVICHC